MYDENYYKSLNYTDYIDRQPKYDACARELSELLCKLCLLNNYTTIFDYGMGFGMLLAGFNKLGYNYTNGYDISPYATQKAKKICNLNMEFRDLNECPNTDILFMFDVLEHMTNKQIQDVFKIISSRVLIFRIPIKAHQEDKDFYLEVSRKDKTHINCKSKLDWQCFLQDFGYKVLLDLKLHTIYDSPGVYCGLGLKY